MVEPFECLEEGVYRIRVEVRKGLIPFAANLYALPGEKGILFDAGFGGRGSVKRLAKALNGIESHSGGRVREVMPSHAHWDHFSGVRPIADERGMSVRMTPEMARLIRSKRAFRKAYLEGLRDTPHRGFFKKTAERVGRRLGDEFYGLIMGVRGVTGAFTPLAVGDVFNTLSGSWEVMAGPGHCDVHLMLWNREKGILLGGDNVLADITTWLGPPRSNIEAYETTLKTIRDLPGLRVIYASHGRSVTEPVRRVTDLLNHRKKRMEDIRNELARAGSRGISVEGIVNRYYPGVSAFRRGVARGWIDITLLTLMGEGTITRYARNGIWRYTEL